MEIVNELGVIVRFASLCESRGLAIELIRSSFPDALIYNQRTDEYYRAEFEFKASSFAAHRHQKEDCDVIICWENDWPDCPIIVWEISRWNIGVINQFNLPNDSAPYIYQKIEVLEKENRQLCAMQEAKNQTIEHLQAAVRNAEERSLNSQIQHGLTTLRSELANLHKETETQLKKARRETTMLDLRNLKAVAHFLCDLPIESEILHKFATAACYGQSISRAFWVDSEDSPFSEDQFNCLQNTLLEYGMATRDSRWEWSLTHVGLALMAKIAKREI